MIFQNTRFQIGNHIDSSGIHTLKEILRIWKSPVIPVKDIAEVVLLAAGIAGCQPKVIDQDALLLMLIDYPIDFLITVSLKFCVIHGRGTISQRLFGGQRAAPCQHRIAV